MEKRQVLLDLQKIEIINLYCEAIEEIKKIQAEIAEYVAKFTKELMKAWDALISALENMRHNDIKGRDEDDAHPLSAISGLMDELSAIKGKLLSDFTLKEGVKKDSLRKYPTGSNTIYIALKDNTSLLPPSQDEENWAPLNKDDGEATSLPDTFIGTIFFGLQTIPHADDGLYIADGKKINLALFPKLKKRIEDGTIRCIEYTGDRSADIGCFMKAQEPDFVYLPDARTYFPRFSGEKNRLVGSTQEDTMQKTVGKIRTLGLNVNDTTSEGCVRIYKEGDSSYEFSTDNAENDENNTIEFDNSLSSRTSHETRPINIAYNGLVFLGKKELPAPPTDNSYYDIIKNFKKRFFTTQMLEERVGEPFEMSIAGKFPEKDIFVVSSPIAIDVKNTPLTGTMVTSIASKEQETKLTIIDTTRKEDLREITYSGENYYASPFTYDNPILYELRDEYSLNEYVDILRNVPIKYYTKTQLQEFLVNFRDNDLSLTTGMVELTLPNAEAEKEILISTQKAFIVIKIIGYIPKHWASLSSYMYPKIIVKRECIDGYVEMEIQNSQSIMNFLNSNQDSISLDNGDVLYFKKRIIYNLIKGDIVVIRLEVPWIPKDTYPIEYTIYGDNSELEFHNDI